MLADLGLTPETAGKMLHVHPRTVRYWISGKTLIPYAAYRLLRILTGAELPANGWDGWHMHSGQLWTPEGHGFKPNDSSWWSLLVRQARCFKTMADLETSLRLLAIRAGDAVAAAGLPAQAGLPAVAIAAPDKEGKPVTPSFFPKFGNFSAFCYKFSPVSSGSFGGGK
ncbi:MAG: VC1465 family Xer recombination activation factor [Rhodoferax sp.]|nr:VC1465 family Xer recombination activation factor [Rhodoferax sp.]